MLRPGQAVVLCVIALLTIGVVMVNSAGMSIDPKRAVTIQSILLSRSTAYMAMALAAMAVVAFLPVRRLAEIATARPSPPATASLPQALVSLRPMWFAVAAIVALLMLVYLPVIGREVNGSARWVALPIGGAAADPSAGGGLSMQPSELAKWGLVLVMAWYGATRAHLLPRFWLGLVPALIAIGIVAGLVIKEDLGTGALIGMVAAVMLLASGARILHFLALAPIGLAVLAVAVYTSPYRINRILAFLDPYADPEGTGYHMIQSMVAVANGQVFGRGLGFGLQKFGYLPEDRTDFLFAVICEELGLMGAAVVVALYCGLLWSGLTIIRREGEGGHPMLRLAALGVILTVGLQAVINLAVVTGVGPTKGIALPMLSSGGTGWILTAASLGLLVALDRAQARDPAGAPGLTTDRGSDTGGGAPIVVTTAARSWPGVAKRAS